MLQCRCGVRPPPHLLSAVASTHASPRIAIHTRATRFTHFQQHKVLQSSPGECLGCPQLFSFPPLFPASSALPPVTIALPYRQMRTDAVLLLCWAAEKQTSFSQSSQISRIKTLGYSFSTRAKAGGTEGGSLSFSYRRCSCLSLAVEQRCPQTLLAWTHVSSVSDNDLSCINRGLSPDTGFFITAAEASRENLQIPDCERYTKGKPQQPSSFFLAYMQTDMLRII